MELSVEEKELIDHYRSACDNDRRRIRNRTKEAADVAIRLKLREGE